MTTNKPTYNELAAMNADLQKQIARSLKDKQDLFNTRDSLDRDLARFKGIQLYSEKVIQVSSLEEFAEITVESIVEAFEVECSALFTYDKTTKNLMVMASSGFEDFIENDPLRMDWIIAKGHLERGTPFIEQTDSDNHPWRPLGLYQMVCSPYYDQNGELQGLVFGGNSVSKQDYYDEIKEEIIPSFMVFIQQMSALLHNFESKDYLDRTVNERTNELKVANEEFKKANKFLQQEIINHKQTMEKLRTAQKETAELSEFLKKMFGRYLSKEVMESLLENPSALELGGERREVTIMMTDLRGFTSLSERLEPEQVVKMLNGYFEVMVDIIHQYKGTINEIVGDSLLVIFGAPQAIPDRAQKAIACAIAMQNSMSQVNQENLALGLPQLEMGIALHDTEAIVGNIGSSKRIKYSVVGKGVNMTSRIESYTVGGQILISESVRQEAGEVLRIDEKKEVIPKGMEMPLAIYEVGSIAGQYNLALDRDEPAEVNLKYKIPLEYKVLGGKHVSKKVMRGHIFKLSKKSCEVALNKPLALLTNIKMNLKDVDQELAAKDFYGKVIRQAGTGENSCLIRFTALPPEISAYFQALRQYIAGKVFGSGDC